MDVLENTFFDECSIECRRHTLIMMPLLCLPHLSPLPRSLSLSPQLLSLDKDALKKKGMTEGAANKLVAKIEELK